MARGSTQKKLSPPANTSYEVGYAKPPEEHRFKAGRSGNPRGRPKGSKNKLPALNEERLKSIILEEAYRSVRVNDGDKQVGVPMAQAIVRSLAVNAAKGNHRAQRLFTELLNATESANKRLHDEWMNVAINYKIEWDRELERRRQVGITNLPEPLPHPDHVIIDIRAGTAIVNGPSTREEKAVWDLWVQRRKDFQEELDELKALRDGPDHEHKEFVAEEIARTETVLAIIDKGLDISILVLDRAVDKVMQ